LFLPWLFVRGERAAVLAAAKGDAEPQYGI
jgi:hypothetical protein